MNYNEISVILPAKNEAKSLPNVISKLMELYPTAEIIVVNDGSSDDTSAICRQFDVVEVLHPYSKGNGAAIKSGIRAATKDIIVCMDADGQHRPDEIALLLLKMKNGFDMVVGARAREGQANLHRSIANGFYNRFASWMVGQSVQDLTSGFRAVKAQLFREFIDLLPNTFSYPTTITMSFFRAGYSVAYENINVQARATGTSSHVNLARDGVRFLLIIFKIGTLFSPLKIFLPISLFLFFSGVSYYAYTFSTDGRFTNMGALLFSTSIIIFLMGLISEQITALLYKSSSKK